MATRRSRAKAPEVTPGVLPDADAEADRRCDFYEAWYALGMTKGTSREAYFEALNAGLFGEDGQADVQEAAQQVAATKPSGERDPIATRRWRRID